MSQEHTPPAEASWEITDGTIVYGIDGAKVGSVRNYDPRAGYLDVQKGWLFPKDFYVPMAAVKEVTGEGVYLRLTSDDLEDNRHAAPPMSEGVESGGQGPDHAPHAQGADEFVEVRELGTPWDPDQPIVREDERYGRLS